LTIEDPADYQLEAVVSESRVPVVQVGTEVTVNVTSLGQQFPGKVREIVPRADPSSRSFLVKIRLESVPGLHSGMYATAFFPAPGQATLTVPESAVIRRGQLVGLYVIEAENHARFRLIKTGRTLDGRIEVLAGVAQGDRVVIDPSHELRDGSAVTISANLPGTGLGVKPGTGQADLLVHELGVEC
jgi:RND family efflux transporter MFP subunit